MLRVSIFWQLRRKHRAVSTPPKAWCPIKTSLFAQDDSCLSTTSKSRDQNPRPLPPGPRKRRYMASGSTASHSPPLWRNDFLVAENSNGKNKTLTCALVAEQSRTSPASSGSTAALDCMADGSKKSSKGRERRKDKENEEGVGQCSKLFNLLFQNSLLPSLFLRLSLPSSSFLGQPRRRPSYHLLFYVRDGGRDKENEKNVAAVQQTVNSLLFNLLFLFPRPLSSASFLGDPQRGPLLLRERALPL